MKNNYKPIKPKSVHANDVEQLHRKFLTLKADYLECVVKLLRKIY